MVKLRIAVVAVTVASALAACSSSSSSTSTSSSSPVASSASATTAAGSAAAYAEAVCGDVTTWKNAVQKEASTFQQDVKNATSPDDVKTALEGFLSTVVDQTAAMVADIQALGAPAVEGGAEAHAALTGALSDIHTLFETALDKVKSIDTSATPQDLAKVLQGIATDLQSGSQDMQDALNGVTNKELDAAFKDTPSCSALQQ